VVGTVKPFDLLCKFGTNRLFAALLLSASHSTPPPPPNLYPPCHKHILPLRCQHFISARDRAVTHSSVIAATRAPPSLGATAAALAALLIITSKSTKCGGGCPWFSSLGDRHKSIHRNVTVFWFNIITDNMQRSHRVTPNLISKSVRSIDM